MTTDRVEQKVIRSRVMETVELHLSPFYEMGIDHWRILIDQFNNGPRDVIPASLLIRYLADLGTVGPVSSNDVYITVGEIVELDGRFFADFTFVNSKPALALLFLTTIENNMGFAPIIRQPNGVDEIVHISLTYISD